MGDPTRGDPAPGVGGLTHLDADGNPRMVDVGAKADSDRMARAEGFVRLSPDALATILEGRSKKGDVLQIARLAGIQAAKRTADLIPLCHPLPIDGVEVDVAPLDGRIRVVATVRTRWRTGVEMEALTCVTAACLTVYDMVKAIDRGMQIQDIRLLEKHGGRSGSFVAAAVPARS
ncbi:MAG: cyclic pyranopterin monophosphate synthase MoaC [Alphaproteobacteria bacterium]|nr:cyclic pyranopterin monophosphate synthase MoaC [Alphaproteobacteria bacterium]